ncbi:hypothetical protein ABZT02_30790 [Streptomyces sp. NPDC005402]|uniref:hypothetical protein n=1 Tax=Streptomyces sp. NPDC005402 TaxID=3155338 RepID=UPI0033A589D6
MSINDWLEHATPGDVLRLFEISEEDHADFDPVSGVLRVNAYRDEWNACMAVPAGQWSHDQRMLMEGVTHEAVHFFQTATTGFMYNLALEGKALVTEYIERTQNSASIYDPKMQAAIAPAVRDLFRSLDEPGSLDITVRDIVESQAFLVQKRSHRPEMGPKEYRALLEASCPGEEYRRAFDMTADVIGDDAFSLFSLAAWASLCFSSPTDQFVELLDVIRKRGTRFDLEHNEKLVVDFMTSRPADQLLGSAFDVRLKRGGHPAYSGIWESLAKYTSASDVPLIHIPSMLHNPPDTLVPTLRQPILFRHGRGEAPSVWWSPPGVTAEESRNKALYLVTLCLASSVVLGGFETGDPTEEAPPVSEGETKESEYVQAVEQIVDEEAILPLSDKPDGGMRVLGFNLSNIEVEISALEGMVRRLAADPPVARDFARTCTMVFEDETGNEVGLDCPAVREAIRAIHGKIPELFYFLSESPKLLEAYAFTVAHSNDDNISELRGRLVVALQAGELLLLEEHLAAAARFARQLEDDWEILVYRHTSALEVLTGVDGAESAQRVFDRLS